MHMGDSFLIENAFGKHLHIIIAQSSSTDPALFMLVYLSTADVRHRDTTTILEPGEHPFVKVRSWVRYQNVLVWTREQIKQHRVRDFGQVSPEVLGRIQAGIESSPFVAGNIRELFLQWKMDRLYGQLE